MQDINQIYKMLYWKNSPEVQLEGKRLAKNITDLSLLVQPPATSSVWEQCANILSEKSDAELEPYLESLLEWLQDLNWPGAITILTRLITYSGQKLKMPLENAVTKANQTSNEYGLRWLDYLSELLDNDSLVSYLSSDTLILLKEHYHNWASWYDE